MPERDRFDVGALNIVATPHPNGIYLQFLRAIAEVEVRLWGSDHAKITPPEPVEGRSGVHFGQILVWAEIDKDGAWLDKETNTEATAAQKQAAVDAIPPNLEPNFRSFYYAFTERNHRLVFQVSNELGERLSPSRVQRLFRRLSEGLPADFPAEIDVTVIPEDDTLDRIFAIPRLRKLEIFITRPNPDDVGDDFDRVMKGLEEEGARSQKIEKVKAAKVKSLKPDKETKTLASIAATNGYVSAEGKDESGNSVFESTAEHPKVREVEVRTSAFGAFLSGLTNYD